MDTQTKSILYVIIFFIITIIISIVLYRIIVLAPDEEFARLERFQERIELIIRERERNDYFMNEMSKIDPWMNIKYNLPNDGDIVILLIKTEYETDIELYKYLGTPKLFIMYDGLGMYALKTLQNIEDVYVGWRLANLPNI